MTDWYAPNQQAVGIDPASGPAPAPQKTAAKKASKKAEDDDE